MPDIVIASELSTVVVQGEGFVGPPGPNGATGPTGPQGPTGPAGEGLRSLLFTFASPATTWTVVHNLGTRVIEVNTFELDGVTEKEGAVSYLDINTVVIDWYYAEAGLVRLLY